MRPAWLLVILLLAGCASPVPAFVAMEGEDSWKRLDCDDGPGPSEPMKVGTAFRGSAEAQARRFADALGLELHEARIESASEVSTWSASDGTIAVATGLSRGWTWTPADKTLPNKTMDEATTYLHDLAKKVGLPEPTGNDSFTDEYGGFSLSLTLETPADFDAIVAWNHPGADNPLVQIEHSVIVAPNWDWATGYTLDVEEAKRIAEAFADCHPSTFEPQGQVSANGELQRTVAWGRPSYYMQVSQGTGSSGGCSPEGTCYHGCPAPTRWVTVDARSGAIMGVSDWSLCY